MVDVATLTALRERVIAATGTDRRIDTELAYAFCELDANHGVPVFECSLGVPPFTTSIDAALGLVKMMLPGWEWLKKSSRVATVYNPPAGDKGWAVHFDGKGSNFALSLVAAALSALIEQENDR